MTVSDIHTAVVSAYRQALSGTEFEKVKFVPIDRETDDLVRGVAETEYDASYVREMGLRVTTVNEDLYYYATSSKKWKVELNTFQEYMEDALLRGIGDLEVTDVSCETGKTGETGGVLHLSFSVTNYEAVDFDGRNTNAEIMEDIDTEVTIHTD